MFLQPPGNSQAGHTPSGGQAALGLYLVCFGYFQGSVALSVRFGLLPGQKRSILREERSEVKRSGYQKASPRNFPRLPP